MLNAFTNDWTVVVGKNVMADAPCASSGTAGDRLTCFPLVNRTLTSAG